MTPTQAELDRAEWLVTVTPFGLAPVVYRFANKQLVLDSIHTTFAKVQTDHWELVDNGDNVTVVEFSSGLRRYQASVRALRIPSRTRHAVEHL